MLRTIRAIFSTMTRVEVDNGVPDADAHVHLGGGVNGALRHHEAVSLDESAPCQAEVGDILLCLRAFLPSEHDTP